MGICPTVKTVYTAYDGGAIFTVENSAAAQNIMPAGARAIPPIGQRARILVADDDASIRRLGAEALKRFGYQTEMATDGVSAWEALQTSHYDLLITDYNMPKLSGLELIKKARSAQMTLPIIVVSGALSEFDRERDAHLQGVATMAKPFSIQQLLETVNKVLGPFQSRV